MKTRDIPGQRGSSKTPRDSNAPPPTRNVTFGPGPQGASNQLPGKGLGAALRVMKPKPKPRAR